ncbi:integral membrane protein [Luteipulveratus halotolerans]|uniref:Integral membrane protein n=1 Tax=Luteipulveratus halotolerans TaxID=1631356 RepID=A0A0L6CN08_9MICO|nr:integral membrane protein [Luteipulveratus halotolerans]
MLARRFLPLVIGSYLLFRLLSAVLMIWLARHQVPEGVPFGPESGSTTTYWDMTRMWDGRWYETIVNEGYPDQLPVQDGALQQNQWAFYPLFPELTRLLMSITGLPFGVVGSMLSLVLGTAAAGVMGVLIRDKVGPAVALAAVCVYAASPPSPTLQMAYTESLAMLLLCGFLLAVQREQWAVAATLALLTGLTRPIALPLGLVALVVVVLRWRDRSERPISRRDWGGMLSTLVACGLAGLMWPAIAWSQTGSPTAYTDTMGTWRVGGEVHAFQPWWHNSAVALGDFWGRFWLLAFVVAMLVAMLGPWARGLGAPMRTWTLGYLLYLGAVLDPWTSIYRYLLFVFPLAVVMVGGGWAPDDERSRVYRFVGLRTVVLVLLGLGWQVWWGWELLRFIPPADNPI